MSHHLKQDGNKLSGRPSINPHPPIRVREKEEKGERESMPNDFTQMQVPR